MGLLTVEQDRADIRDQCAGQGLDQAGFACAVVADDGQDLAGVQVEVGAGDRGHSAVAFDQSACLESWFTHRDLRRTMWWKATAAITRTPVATSWYRLSIPACVNPLRSTATISAPTTVPRTLPRPPNRLVPPITTAVMLSRLPVWK